MRKFFAFLLGLCLLPVGVRADQAPTFQLGCNGGSCAAPTAVTTATTTLIVAGNAGQRLYLYFLAEQAGGTQSAETFYFEYGTTTSTPCDTGTTKLGPGTPFTGPTTAGQFTFYWGTGNVQGAAANIAPATVPVVLPAGNNLCMVTAGTTISAIGVAVYLLQ